MTFQKGLFMILSMCRDACLTNEFVSTSPLKKPQKNLGLLFSRLTFGASRINIYSVQV